MLKIASIEETEITDSKTGKKIRISTTTRLLYRKINPQEYASMRNARLNLIIAEDFASQSGNVLHYFRLGKEGRDGVGEIRGSASAYFISAVKDEFIDILTIQRSWLKPKYQGSRENPIALGDE